MSQSWAKVYRRQGGKADYVRQAGFDPIQQEQMVLTYIDKHGSIKRAEVMELCRINKDQAYRVLDRLKKNGKIRLKGERKAAFYERQR
jgi:ATP-dependent DNA helicase RecG